MYILSTAWFLVHGNNLTSFCYNRLPYSSSNLVEILPRLYQLRKLDIQVDARVDLAFSSTVLPNLDTLALQQVTYGQIQGLQHLILPALANLKLIDFWDSRLLTVLEQSRCSLKQFAWKSDDIDLQPFRQLLEVSPTLEEVTLIVVSCGWRWCSSVRELIPLFTCRPDTEVLLPNLQLIDISASCYKEWPQDDILLAMVESRIAHRKGLVVHLPYVELDDAVKQRVDNLQKRGCTLNLKHTLEYEYMKLSSDHLYSIETNYP